ncbi:MAG: hypothetical protein Q7R52_04670 [archaeon]|nr:hypothetical protein [archaeon]
MNKLSKSETEKEIKEFFEDINKKSPKEIKKIKKLAMRYNLKLGSLRKKFCKKCYSTRLKTLNIKRGIKKVQCEKCKSIFRWKLTN